MYTRIVTSTVEPARLGLLCDAPILVVGAPRSGTTVVQRTLLADPRCCGGQESHFFASFGRSLRDFDRKAAMDRPHGLACYWTRAQLVGHLRGLWIDAMSGIVRSAPDAELLVEKTPDHALWLDVAADVLPRARVVHVVRDSRSVVESLLAASRAPWGRAWAPRSSVAAARLWREHVEAVERCSLPVHRIRFEDLEHDPLPALRALWRFAGLAAPDDELLRLRESAMRGDATFVATGAFTHTPPEPAGFDRRGGARVRLGWIDRLRVWRETGGAMRRLGYGRAVTARGTGGRTTSETDA